jgi:hypothetical protein
LSLDQRGSTVTGTATGQGVDAPLFFTVSGVVHDSSVVLQLGYADGFAKYAAVLRDSALVGQAVFDSVLGGRVDSLTYVRR